MPGSKRKIKDTRTTTTQPQAPQKSKDKHERQRQRQHQPQMLPPPTTTNSNTNTNTNEHEHEHDTVHGNVHNVRSQRDKQGEAALHDTAQHPTSLHTTRTTRHDTKHNLMDV